MPLARHAPRRRPRASRVLRRRAGGCAGPGRRRRPPRRRRRRAGSPSAAAPGARPAPARRSGTALIRPTGPPSPALRALVECGRGWGELHRHAHDRARQRDELVGATRSSTACASSMPGVPAITEGMPRAVNRRMSAPHGTPARAPRGRARRSRTTHESSNGGPAVSAGANCPPVQRRRACGQAPATAASTPARAAAASAPTGTPRGPRTRAGRAPGSTTRRRARGRRAAGRAAPARASAGARRRR